MATNLNQIGARFHFYMKIKHLGIHETSLLTNTPDTLISNILAGKNYTMDELLKVLSGLKELNAHWVIYGEGNVFKRSATDGPILPEKRLQHLKEMQQLLAQLDDMETDKMKTNKSQLDALKARISFLTSHI